MERRTPTEREGADGAGVEAETDTQRRVEAVVGRVARGVKDVDTAEACAADGARLVPERAARLSSARFELAPHEYREIAKRAEITHGMNSPVARFHKIHVRETRSMDRR